MVVKGSRDLMSLSSSWYANILPNFAAIGIAAVEISHNLARLPD